jgi:hypothetical protein
VKRTHREKVGGGIELDSPLVGGERMAMGCHCPAPPGREIERQDGPTMMDAHGSSWNTSVASGTRNDAKAIATKTLGRLISMERHRARGLIRMVAPASKLMEREREDERWVIERGVRERESQRRRMIRSGSWPAELS